LSISSEGSRHDRGTIAPHDWNLGWLDWFHMGQRTPLLGFRIGNLSRLILFLFEDDLAVLDVGDNDVTIYKLAVEHIEAKWIEEMCLDRAF
jgi:hypothetical protein